MRELTKKDFTPPPAGIDKFGLGDVAEIIIRELTKQGYVPSSDDGSDKDFRWMPEPIIAKWSVTSRVDRLERGGSGAAAYQRLPRPSRV